MTVNIQLHYHTNWGESVRLVLGRRRIPMEYSFGGLWQIMLTGRDIHAGDRYGFEIVRDGAVVRKEWRNHRLTVTGKSLVIVRNRWNERPSNSAFYSSAFSDVIFRRPDGASFRNPRTEASADGNVTFEIPAPEVRSNESVGIVGTGKVLGNWDKVILLSDARAPWWSVSLNLDEPVEYKFVIADSKTLEIRHWEEGPNHFFAEVPPKGEKLVIADLAPTFPTVPWRGAGVAVPVFSLKTEDSFGVGEFNDIKKLVDWAVKAGQNIIQLLPINDTTMTHTWQDSYPYNAVSSFALHPQFINLPAAGVRKDAAYKAKQAELEALGAEDYEAVNSCKMEYLRKLYKGAKGEKVLASAEYQEFVKKNSAWLLPYAVFSVLRDIYGTPDFSTWKTLRTYKAQAVKAFADGHSAEVGFYCYLQFILDAQLRDAVQYAHVHGVAIKGDLPIGVSRVSADAWQHPELFHMDSQAGAPPDAFAEDGQNWGFPTYNWEEMAKDGYAWWKARMGKMAEYFDAFRIDHILGFFRIWEIPVPHKSGLLGHFSPALPYSEDELRGQGFDPHQGSGTDVLFVEDPRRKGYWHPRISGEKTSVYASLSWELKDRYNRLSEDFFWHRHDDFWRETAMKKLPALLRSTGMLACGEDLGMIPGCVASVMADLNVLSLEIQRMPKDPREAFGHTENYPYWCVCATGTHDTSPIRAWWEEDRALTQRYYNEILGQSGDAPYFCEPWVADMIVGAHMKSPAMLSILPLQDYLATDGDVRYSGNPADERINIPAIPRHYWRYRMHCTLESLIGNDGLNAHIRSLAEDAGRGL